MEDILLHIRVRFAISNLCKFVKFSASASLSLSPLSSCLLLATASEEASKGLSPKRRLLLCTDQGGREKEDGTLHIFKKESPLLHFMQARSQHIHSTSCNTRIPVSSFGLGREPANISSTTRRFPLLSSPLLLLCRREKNTYEGQKAHKTGWGTTGEDGRSIFQKMETGSEFAQLYTVR